MNSAGSGKEFDVIVSGASVAGSSTAFLLSRQGFRVLLVDKATFPRDKICGEGLMPTGAAIAARHGLFPAIRKSSPQWFEGIHFHLSDRLVLPLRFDQLDRNWRGWVVERTSLDNALLDLATSQSGVSFREGFLTTDAQWEGGGIWITGSCGGRTSRYRGRALIAADGLHSRLRTRLGIPHYTPSSRRLALCTYHRDFRPTQEAVEVHCSQLGEAYVAPFGRSAARVTLLLYQARIDGWHLPASLLYRRALSHFPTLTQAELREDSDLSVHAVAPLATRLPRCHGDRFLLVGDAGGAVDPVTGQGMTIALRDAELAAEVLTEALVRDRLDSASLAPYTRRRNQYFRPAYHTARLLLFVLRHPRLATRLAKALRRHPELGQRILESAIRTSARSGLTRTELLRLLTASSLLRK